MTKKRSQVFFRKKMGMTPSVAAPGDTNPSGATAREQVTHFAFCSATRSATLCQPFYIRHPALHKVCSRSTYRSCVESLVCYCYDNILWPWPDNDLYIKTWRGSYPNMWRRLVWVAFWELLGARSKKKERTTAKHGAHACLCMEARP